jgi:uncharacterized protein YcfJ
MKKIACGLILSMLLIRGCGNTTGTRALSGAAMSAAAGGVIGSLTGDFGKGAAIGAAAGAVGGYLYDQYEKGNID